MYHREVSDPGPLSASHLESLVERWTDRLVERLASGAPTAAVVREHLTAAIAEATAGQEPREEPPPPSVLVRQRARDEERLRLILDASGMGTWDLDLDTMEMVTDERFQELFGLTCEQADSPEERLARVHPEDLERAWQAMGEAAAGASGGVYFQHYRTRSLPGGGWRWVEARGRAVRGADGKSRLIGTLLDVTERKQLEAQRERAVLLHQRQAEFEQHLVGIVSHDLRTPLNAILLGASALVASEQLDGTSLRIASRIRSSAERAGRMIRDLLDFTQARLGGGIPVRPGRLDLHALVHHVVEEVEASTPGRRIELHHEGDGALEGDSDRLAQLVVNLLTNALAYSSADTPVRVTTRGSADTLTLTIQNQGAPIAAEKRASLFEPMQRATADIDRQGRSVGLGLYIVRHIADAHHGTVEVTSTEDEGTTFTVHLPRRQVTVGPARTG